MKIDERRPAFPARGGFMRKGGMRTGRSCFRLHGLQVYRSIVDYLKVARGAARRPETLGRHSQCRWGLGTPMARLRRVRDFRWVHLAH